MCIRLRWREKQKKICLSNGRNSSWPTGCMIKEELNLWSGVDWVFQSTHLCFHAMKTQPRLFQPLNELDMFLGVSCELILSEKVFALVWFLLVNQNIFTWQAFLTYLCNHETFSKKTQREFNETLSKFCFSSHKPGQQKLDRELTFSILHGKQSTILC